MFFLYLGKKVPVCRTGAYRHKKALMVRIITSGHCGTVKNSLLLLMYSNFILSHIIFVHCIIYLQSASCFKHIEDFQMPVSLCYHHTNFFLAIYSAGLIRCTADDL